jgi:hypothetical protein
LLAYREIDDAFGLTDMAAYELTDNRNGKKTQYSLTALLQQSVHITLWKMAVGMNILDYAIGFLVKLPMC